MSTNRKQILHCAIYTRKSSEEGLDQSFNSLDAQREACEAFILSQRHEGWCAAPSRYDDGGYSGGNIERPALSRLLEDVEAKKIHVIVVYKVDRLTRSLSDFAKIVEALDSRNVSFVSVTQQFNTTSSMGRLTLNVLLSFAQFEREVTGERIRDKIAASKKKGMWMGGLVPLGYDLEGRKLVPDPKQAALVCKIFADYLELGCVSKLALRLASENLKSKIWTTKSSGKRLGGNRFARGALYELLRNRLYVGEIRHRDQWYPGEHPGIVPPELWDRVQAKMTSNSHERRNRAKEHSASLLTGLIEDAEGNRFTPSFTIKNGRRYHYYVSQSVVNKEAGKSESPERLPAHEIESRIKERICAFLKSDSDLFDELSEIEDNPSATQQLRDAASGLTGRWSSLRPEELKRLLNLILHRVVVHESYIEIMIGKTALREVLKRNSSFSTDDSETSVTKSIHESDLICLTIEVNKARTGGQVHLVVSPGSLPTEARPNPSLVKAIARAYSWSEQLLNGQMPDQNSIARDTGLHDRYVCRVLRCAFLAPDIVEAILEGRHPPDLTFKKLCNNIPMNWADQRKQFGFPAR
jgi:site-specific DNA recombinase